MSQWKYKDWKKIHLKQSNTAKFTGNIYPRLNPNLSQQQYHNNLKYKPTDTGPMTQGPVTLEGAQKRDDYIISSVKYWLWHSDI